MTGNLCPHAANRVRGSIPPIRSQEKNPAPPRKTSPAEDKEKPFRPKDSIPDKPGTEQTGKRVSENSNLLWSLLWSAPRKTEYPQKEKVPETAMISRTFVGLRRRSAGIRTDDVSSGGLDIPKAPGAFQPLICKAFRAFLLGMGCSLADFEELVSATSGGVYGRVCGQKFWLRFPYGDGFAGVRGIVCTAIDKE